MLKSLARRLVCFIIFFSGAAGHVAAYTIAGELGQAPASDVLNGAVSDEPTILFATSTANAEPLAELHGNQLTGGILKELGDAIGAKLHRKVIYVALPRKRLESELEKGKVDAVCYYRPEWLPMKLNWSAPVIPNEILLVIRHGVPTPNKLQDIEGKSIGTVLGYKYPELAELHTHYQREDAPTMLSNIKKLAAGRFDYAVIDRLSLDYYKKTSRDLDAASTLPITKINASCGFSLASKIPIEQINLAMHELIDEGAIERILAGYR